MAEVQKYSQRALPSIFGRGDIIKEHFSNWYNSSMFSPFVSTLSAIPHSRTLHSISKLSWECSKTLSSIISSDGKLKPSSNSLVPSPIEEEGKGSEQGILCNKEERRGSENAWWDEKDPLSDFSRPIEDTKPAELDKDVLTWAQYLTGRMEGTQGSWDQGHREERHQIHQTWEGKENKEACVKHLSGTMMNLTLSKLKGLSISNPKKSTPTLTTSPSQNL